MKTTEEYSRRMQKLTGDRVAGRISEAVYQLELRALNRLRFERDAMHAAGSSADASTLSHVPPSDSPYDARAGYDLDEYRLVRHLGAGAFGQVWLAFSEVEDRHVAVKILPRELSRNEREMERVRRCFRTVHRLQHQNICPVYRLARHGELGYYLVMKFIDGPTLDDWRESLDEERLPLERILSVLGMVAGALDYAHSQKVVHRDIKPGNVLTSSDTDDVQIVDFGLAEQIHSSMSRISTTSEQGAGTPAYMSPEACLGKPPDGYSDQYSLACLAYYLVAGRPPFQGSPMVVISCHREQSPQPIEKMSVAFNKAVLRGLAKHKNERFANCMEFAEALRSAAAQGSLATSETRRISESTKTPATARRRTSPIESTELSEPWRQLDAPQVHETPMSLSFARNSNQLVAAYRGGTIVGWMDDSRQFRHWVHGVTPPLTGAVFTPEGGFLVITGVRSLVVADALTRSIVTRAHIALGRILSLHSLASSREICCASDAGRMLFINLITGVVTRSTVVGSPPPKTVGMSHSGKLIVACRKRDVSVYGVGTLLTRRLATLPIAKKECAPLQVSFTRDDKYIAVRYDDGTVRVIDWQARGSVDMSVESFRLTAFAFSPDTRLLLGLSDDATLVIFDLFSGQQQQRISLPAPGSHVACSADGRVAIALGEAGFIVADDIL